MTRTLKDLAGIGFGMAMLFMLAYGSIGWIPSWIIAVVTVDGFWTVASRTLMVQVIGTLLALPAGFVVGVAWEFISAAFGRASGARQPSAQQPAQPH